MEEREELEHVPWADLMAESEPEDRRRRAMYLGIGMVGALVLGVIVARSWWATPSVPTPLAPAAERRLRSRHCPMPRICRCTARRTSWPILPIPPPGSPWCAEWFVADYFTADLEPSGSADVRAALPPSVAEDLALDIGDAVSYVEWARAYRVEEAGDGIYRVSVAFRTLGAPPDRGFTRQPVRAVEVLVAVGGDSGATIVDLPSPIFLSLGPEAPVWVGEEATPPQEIVDLVSTRASLWGSEPQIVSAQHLGGEWRVVVTIADAVGARWPFALRIEVEG